MNLTTLIDSLLSDTLETSLPLFRPELAICITIVVMLLVRVFKGGEYIPSFLLALLGTGFAFWLAVKDVMAAGPAKEIFTGLLVYDSAYHFDASVLAGLRPAAHRVGSLDRSCRP